MALIRLISWPYVRQHVLRTALTTAGIVLGVAVFVGMHTANDSVVFAFSSMVDRIAGRTQLQVTAGEAGFPEAVLDQVQSASTVRVAVPVIEAVVDSRLPGAGSVLVLGIDMTGDRTLRDFDLQDADDTVDDPLVFLAQPDSLIVSKAFADRHHLRAGSRLPLSTANGEQTFTIRGILATAGLMSAFGGNLAVMDIYAAQKIFGRGRTFDRIDLAVKPGVTLSDSERELEALLGPGFEVQPPSSRGRQFETMISGYALMMNISSAFAIFIGMFIIYNAFAIAATQRRTEIGIMRALGATRRQILRLFLTESVVMGAVGSILGVACGVLIGRAIAASIGSLIQDVYGVAQRAGETATSPLVLGGAVLLGMATSMVAAAIPARAAARVDPVHALQKGQYQQFSARQTKRRAVGGGVLILLSFVCLTAAVFRPVFYVGYGLGIVAALVVLPILSTALANLIRPGVKWLRPVEGSLAADSLIQAPRRTSASVAALMLALALSIAFAGMAGASYQSIVGWIATTLNPDLFVLPTPTVGSQAIRFPAAMAAEIQAIPGVDRVQPLRSARIVFRKTPVMVVAVDMQSAGETLSIRPVAGNSRDMYRLCAEGRGVMISDNFAQIQHVALGDMLDVPAPFGRLHLPVVAIIVDYSDQQGSIIVERRLFADYWHDDTANLFRIYAKQSASLVDVRQRILDRYAGQRQVFVMTNDEMKSYIMKIADQWFGLSTVQIAVAVLVAILGIANTLTVSITDRRRELGVLQAVGALHRQVRHTIWIEALSVGFIGLLLGLGLGAVNLYYVLQIVQHDINGMRVDYQFPLGTALMLVPTILAAAFIAAIWPAESAVRGTLVEALEYE